MWSEKNEPREHERGVLVLDPILYQWSFSHQGEDLRPLVDVDYIERMVCNYHFLDRWYRAHSGWKNAEGEAVEARATGVFFTPRILEYLQSQELKLEELGSPAFRDFLNRGEGELVIGCLTEAFPDILLHKDRSGFLYNIHHALKRLKRRPANTLFLMALDNLDHIYQQWCVDSGEEPVMRAAHFPYFERDIFLRTPRADLEFLASAPLPHRSDKSFVVLCARLHIHRLAFFYEILRRGWIDQSVFSCLNRDNFIAGDMPAEAVYYLSGHRSEEDMQKLAEFIAAGPHVLDDQVSWNYYDNKIPSQAILRGGLHVVLESDMDEVPFVTEKTYKAILAGQPFLILGSPGSLKVLREKGYETFPELFNENYDNVPSMSMRFKAVIGQLQRWQRLSDTERQYRLSAPEMVAKLQRNRQRLLERNSKLEMYAALGINSSEPIEAKYLY